MAAKKKKKVSKRVSAKKRKPTRAEGLRYTASLLLNGDVFNATGDTAQEACANLVPFIPRVAMKEKAYLNLHYSGKAAQQIMLAIQLRRFLSSRVARDIHAKRLEARLA